MTVPQQEAIAPVPFFTDSRTLAQKLAADEREWRPHEPKFECPNMIFGLVLERGHYYSDFKDTSGENKVHETARILTEDNVVWSVIAFHGFLQSEFKRKDPRVGDFVALGYQGTRPARKPGESDANVYRMEVERNPGSAVAETNDRGNDVLAGSDPVVPIPDDDDVLDEDDESTKGGEHDDIPFE